MLNDKFATDSSLIDMTIIAIVLVFFCVSSIAVLSSRLSTGKRK